jgi:hypothetical protein
VQQAAVPGQQHALPGVGELDQFRVVDVTGIGGVQADDPHPPGQRPEVHVEQEARGRDLLRPRYREHPHVLAATRAVTKLSPRAVHEQRADLGAGNAE